MAPKVAAKSMPVKQWEHFRVNPPPPPVSIEPCHDFQKAFCIFHMYVHVSVFGNFGERFPKEGRRPHLMSSPFFWSLSTKDRHASGASSSDGTWASDATWAANPAAANDDWNDDWGMHAWDQARSSA